jgi:2-aminobenzoate-CoA ligase
MKIADKSDRAAGRSGHVDDFCARNSPPPELLPKIFYSRPELQYPDRLNCASELLDKAVEAGWGSRTALIYEDQRWTYAQLLSDANRIANVLRDEFRLVPGNRVLLRSPNNPKLIASWFAVLKAGGVVVCTSPLLRVRELSTIAEKAQISLALSDARVSPECKEAFRHGTVVEFSSDSENSLDALAAKAKEQFSNYATSADDAALLAFTSGTTGRPKATIHTHRDVMAGTDCFSKFILRPSADDIFIGSAPLAFTYGLGGVLLFPIRHGSATILIERTTPRDLLAAIERYGVTVCFTAPTAYRAMLKELAPLQVKSLRKCVSAGETLPRTTFEHWLERTGLKIIDGIGSTEMFHIFISAPEDEIRPGSTGKAVPGYEAAVLDDDGRELPPGEIGHLAVRGCTGCKYLDDIEQQQKYVRNGWNLTGDSYKMDSDGYFWYQARTDDMIISSGYNISGVEVEHVLLDHKKVADCAVVGMADNERGHVVKAFIVPAAGISPCDELKKELQDWVKSQIAPYKYPRAVEFVSALPKTTTGKLQRFQLRQQESQ